MNVKDAVLAILSKSLTAQQAFDSVDDKDELAAVLFYTLQKSKMTKGGLGESIGGALAGSTMRTGGPTADPGAAASIGAAFGKKECMKTDKNGQWKLDKMEPLSKPPVSEAQRKAMWAAAGGHSNLGIPSSVGKDFAESDPGGKLPQKKKKDMEKEEKVYAPVRVQMDSDTYDEQGKHNPDLGSPEDNGGKGKKKLKKSWTENAQWSLEKAIKEGPTLDYGKMNPKKDYKALEAKAPVIDYGNNRMAAPKAYAGAAEHAAGVRAKLDAESKETAAETIARRQKANKSEDDHAYKEDGVNLEANPSPSDVNRMTAKNDLSGYGTAMHPVGGQKGALMQSESEPHKDDPDHEAKEKEKAKKIKDEAEGILDMHKKDDGLRTVTVPKDNEMKIKATRAQPAC